MYDRPVALGQCPVDKYKAVWAYLVSLWKKNVLNDAKATPRPNRQRTFNPEPEAEPVPEPEPEPFAEVTLGIE